MSERKPEDMLQFLKIKGEAMPQPAAALVQQARKSAKMAVGRLTRAEIPVPRAVICSLAATPRLRCPFVARTGSRARRRVSNPQ